MAGSSILTVALLLPYSLLYLLELVTGFKDKSKGMEYSNL